MLLEKKLQAPIKWHGGKHYLADWIISHMPPHTHYVEPYFGGGAVLLRKDPEGVSEVVNDINGGLSNFWAVLADDILFNRLKELCEKTPFSESVFDQASWQDGRDGLSVHDAHAFFVRVRQSRQGLMRDFATMSRNRTRRGMNEQVSNWLTAIEGLPEAHARLRRVVVLSQPAVDVIKSQDGPNTLFYLDPPYLHETRVTKSDYQHEMTAEDHAELLDVLTGIQGKFLLSGYPSRMYADAARDACWFFADKEIDNKASSSKTKPKKIERLWMNYDPKELS